MVCEASRVAFVDLKFGGTEEQIIARGTDWCTDVARVGCALYQVVGFPCRIVNIFNLDAAYSGHVIVEVYRLGTWGAVDTSSGVVYRRDDGLPATTWDLMNAAELVARHEGPKAWYTQPSQFTAAGVANYRVQDSDLYDYTVTGLNEFTRAILAMSEQGWPGGVRCLPFVGLDRAGFSSIRAIVMNLLTFMSRVKIK